MLDLRCPNVLQAIVLDDAILEIKCRNRRCGARAGVVILHRFSLITGEMIETKAYRDPRREVNHDTANPSHSLRSA
jgi:hypothetical protein